MPPLGLALAILPLAAPLDFLTRLVDGSAWSYLAIVALVTIDSFLPIAPSETLVITAGVLATQGALSLVLVIAASWIGAVAGDNVSYLLGDRLGDRAASKLFRGKKGRSSLEWGRRQIRERPWVIVVARFIPGGRTAVTFSSGWLGLPWRRFMAYDVPAGLLWSLYSALLGYFGGTQFRQDTWKALLLAFGLAAAISGAIEGLRRLRRRRGAPSA